jgi:hypothetical protein
MVVRNLEDGVQQGLYRKNIAIETLARYRVEQVQLAFNQDVFPFPQFKVDELQMIFFDHFIHGVLSLKGHKLYSEYQKLNDEE